MPKPTDESWKIKTKPAIAGLGYMPKEEIIMDKLIIKKNSAKPSEKSTIVAFRCNTEMAIKIKRLAEDVNYVKGDLLRAMVEFALERIEIVEK